MKMLQEAKMWKGESVNLRNAIVGFKDASTDKLPKS